MKTYGSTFNIKNHKKIDDCGHGCCHGYPNLIKKDFHDSLKKRARTLSKKEIEKELNFLFTC